MWITAIEHDVDVCKFTTLKALKICIFFSCTKDILTIINRKWIDWSGAKERFIGLDS